MRCGVAYDIVGGDLVWEARRASDAELVASGSIPQGGSPYEVILASSPFYGGFYILLWGPDPDGVAATPADLFKVDVVAGTSTLVGSILGTSPSYANVGCNLDGSEARCFLIDEFDAVSTRMAYDGTTASLSDVPLPLAYYGPLAGNIMETPDGRLYLDGGINLYTSGDQGDTWTVVPGGSPRFKYAYGTLVDFAGSTGDGVAPRTMVSPTESADATWGDWFGPVTTTFNSISFGPIPGKGGVGKSISILGGVYKEAELGELVLDLADDEWSGGSGSLGVSTVSYATGDMRTYSYEPSVWLAEPVFFIPYAPGTRPPFWTARKGVSERP